MPITCFIRYEIEPAQPERCADDPRRGLEVIPDRGGDLIGHFLAHEGTNCEAFGIAGFADLAEYERLRSDPAAAENFGSAREHGFILREERRCLSSLQARERG